MRWRTGDATALPSRVPGENCQRDTAASAARSNTYLGSASATAAALTEPSGCTMKVTSTQPCRRVRRDRLEEVPGAVEVGPPDRVLVGGAEQGGQVDDGVDPVHRGREHGGVLEIAQHGSCAVGQRHVTSHQRAAGEAGGRQPRQEPGADQSGGTREKKRGHDRPVQ